MGGDGGMFHVEHSRTGAMPAGAVSNFPIISVKMLHAARGACILFGDSNVLLGMFHVEHSFKSDGSCGMLTLHRNGVWR